MDSFYDLVARRASCRSFLPDPIPEDVLRRVLNAGCQSPNGGGFQTYSILCIEDPEKKEALAGLCRNQRFIARAPMNLVFCIDFHRMEQVLRIEPAPFGKPADFKELCAQSDEGRHEAVDRLRIVVQPVEVNGLFKTFMDDFARRKHYSHSPDIISCSSILYSSHSTCISRHISTYSSKFFPRIRWIHKSLA